MSGARAPWRDRLAEIIFEAHTPAGKAFDLLLMVLIAIGAVVVVLLSMESMRASAGGVLLAIELAISVLFLIEYALRLVSAQRPLQYATSPFGLIDLVSTVAPLVALAIPQLHTLAIVRLARVLRILRILRIAAWVQDADVLTTAVRASVRKIALFMGFVLVVVVLLGAVMYSVEGPAHGFTSIPVGVYWAIVTVTTVGYGDIAPQTALGKTLASAAMLMGYAILAVPTGIVASELGRGRRGAVRCPRCDLSDHDVDATWCRRCGERMRIDGDARAERA